MQLSDAIRKRIKYYLKINKTNLWGIYKKTGIPMTTISSFMRGDRELLTLRTLLHVCEGFNITLKQFFDDPMFDDVEQE